MAPEQPDSLVRDLLAAPADDLDYADAKLRIDAAVDPSLDLEAAKAEIERLTEVAWSLTKAEAVPAARLAVLRTAIYQPGPWNDHNPFAYEMSDPLGHDIRNKLLPVYLATRRGNCISMPILFLILGQRMGLDLALATAPLHVFVRYRDEQGRIVNLETTSGALPARDAWYRQNMPMTELALRNGLYMRSLPRREGVALMAGTLVEHLASEGRWHELISVCETILRHYPRDVFSMLSIAAASAHLLQEEFIDKYAAPYLVPPLEGLRYLSLAERNSTLFEAAETLGWRPQPTETLEGDESCSHN